MSVAVLVLVASMCLLPWGRNLYSMQQQKRMTLIDMLAPGDEVALDSLAEGTRIMVIPNESFWQRAGVQAQQFDRGVVTGVYDDYVSIRIMHPTAPDPLSPQGMTRLIHLPKYAIARVTTFTETR